MCWREIEGETGEWSGYSVCITWPLNRDYPALLRMIKSWDMLPNSMESHELGIKIKESVSTLLLLYTNFFHSYKDSNNGLLTQWVQLFTGLLAVTREWTNFLNINIATTIWRFRCVIIFIGIDYESVYSAVYFMYSSSTVFTCLQTAADSSSVTAAKFSANCCTSRGLNVKFFAAILLFTELQIFSMEFKSGQ